MLVCDVSLAQSPYDLRVLNEQNRARGYLTLLSASMLLLTFGLFSPPPRSPWYGVVI